MPVDRFGFSSALASEAENQFPIEGDAESRPDTLCPAQERDLEAGFPEGTFQTLLIGSGQGDALLNDPRVVAQL